VPQKLVEDATPISIEKPFIRIDSAGKYELVTPQAGRGTIGTQWDVDDIHSYVDGFEKVFVASNTTTVTVINTKLARGLHVVLAPGIYHLLVAGLCWRQHFLHKALGRGWWLPVSICC
jgi:hypothetical protein